MTTFILIHGMWHGGWRGHSRRCRRQYSRAHHDTLRALGIAGVFPTSTDFEEIARGMHEAARVPSN